MAVTTVPCPTNWPTVKGTYAYITNELNTAGTMEQKLAAIWYWRKRLDEDALLIASGLAAATPA